jgi:hypothetical protein
MADLQVPLNLNLSCTVKHGLDLDNVLISPAAQAFHVRHAPALRYLRIARPFLANRPKFAHHREGAQGFPIIIGVTDLQFLFDRNYQPAKAAKNPAPLR